MLTKNEINMAEELTDKLWNQGDLIAKVLCGMTKDEFFENVEFLTMPTGEKGIAITIHNGGFGEWRTRIEWFPEEYLSKSEDELVIELYRRRLLYLEPFFFCAGFYHYAKIKMSDRCVIWPLSVCQT